jgi:hypothetical protein
VSTKEIAFIDPSVSDLETLLVALRPDIAAVLLDSSEPAAAQIAKALQDRTLAGHSGFAGVHVLAHDAPGEVAFAAGPLSLETIDEHRASLAAIGPALAKDGEVLLWSCETGRSAHGAAFSCRSGAGQRCVGRRSDRPGRRRRAGGGWALDGAPALRAPLIALGIAAYTGVMVAINWLGRKGQAD